MVVASYGDLPAKMEVACRWLGEVCRLQACKSVVASMVARAEMPAELTSSLFSMSAAGFREQYPAMR